jgi:hypothetical protein
MQQNKKAVYTFSSDPALNAKNIQNNGSKFTVFADGNPFYVGTDSSTNCTVEVITASIWNNQPNISANYNNNRFVVYDNKSQSRKIEIVIPNGQYDLTALVAQIGLQWDNYSGFDTDTKAAFTPSESFQNTFNIVGSDATQLVSIQFLIANVDLLIDWKISTIGKILGFSPLAQGHPDISKGYIIGNTTASFNSINNYYLSSDLISQGASINGKYGNVIAIVPITSLPGNLVNFNGNVNNLFVESNNILGRRNGKSQITFWVTNEKNEALDMAGEFFSFTILVRWTET